MALDIGTITGQVDIEDRFSEALDGLAEKAHHALSELEGAFGTVAGASLAAAGAITLTIGGIIAMATAGSKIADVENSFNRLTGSVETSDEIMQAMRKGVAGTVTDFELMVIANKALRVGSITTAEGFGTMTAAARILAKETGESVVGSMADLERAMVTGRVKGLELAGVHVDLKSAESAYAVSIGKTTDKLTPNQKLLVDRKTIMEALEARVARAGDVEMSFAEKVDAGWVSLKNWFEELEKSISKSPAVNNAFDTMQKAISDAFGGSSQAAIDKVVGWVNKFADGVTYYGPIVVGWLVKIKDWIYHIWQTVVDAWDIVPQWFKNLAENAGIAGGAMLLTNAAMEKVGVTSGDMLSTASNLSQVWGTFGGSFKGALGSLIQWGAFMMAFGWEGVTVAVGALGKALLALAMPTLVTALVTGLAFALYKVGTAIAGLIETWRSGKSMWDFFTKKEDDTFLRRWLGWSTAIEKTGKSIGDIVLPVEHVGQVIGEGLPPPDAPGKLSKFQEAVKGIMDTLRGESSKTLETVAALNTLTKSHDLSKESIDRMVDAIDSLHEKHLIVEGDLTKWADANRTLKGTVDALHGPLTQLSVPILDNTKHIDAMRAKFDEARDSIHNLESYTNEFHDGITQAGDEISTVTIPMFGKLAGGTAQASAALDEAHTNLGKVAGQSHDTSDALHALSDMFVKLGQISGGVMGELMQGMGQISVMMGVAEDQKFLIGKDGNELGGKFGVASTMTNPNATGAQSMGAAATGAMSIVGGIGEMKDATESHRTAAGNALGGALAGAKMGAAFGPYGMAIGAAAGLIVGIIRGKPEWAKAADEVGKDFGVKISDALAKEIAALEKSEHTTRVGAELLSLSKILKEAGGLSADNLSLMTSKMHDVFSMIETHQLTIAQGAKIMDENFADFAMHSTSEAGVLNKAMQEIVRLNGIFKTDSKAIADYIGGQLAGAETSFATSLGITSGAITKRADLVAQASKMRSTMNNDEYADIAKLADLEDKYAKADATHKMAIQVQMDKIISKNEEGYNSYLKITDQIQTQDKIIALTSLTTQAGVDAVSASILGMIGADIKSGMSFVESVTKMMPALNSLQTQLEVTGLQGGEAFDFIRGLAVMATDEVAGPALKAVNGYSSGMVNLANAGMLNQASFGALSAQIGGTEVALEKEGYTHDQVMMAMKVDLQRVWELQHQYGYKVDESTQNLLNEGEAAGILGEKQQNASDRMVSALDRVVAVLEAMGIKMGALPDKAASVAAGINTAFDRVNPVINYSYKADNQPDFNPQVPMAAGGAGYAAGPMTFTTKGNEFFAFGGEGGGPIQGSGQQDNSELLAEMQRQRAELAALRRDLTFTVPNYTAKAVAMAIQKS